MPILVCSLFLLSGASALIFEVLWFHQAGLALGNSIPASSLVLTGFMGGLALGNFLAARLGDRSARPLRTYALLEAFIAITGVGIVYVLPVLGPTVAGMLGPLAETPWLLNAVRLLLSLAILLLPAGAMGATLPLLCRELTGRDPRFGTILGVLYGCNTLGAVLGILTAENLFIQFLGIRGSAWLAGSFNLLCAAGALGLAKRRSASIPNIPAPSNARLDWQQGQAWLAAAFVSGFCMLALEVVWFRFLSLYVLGQTAAFALMLAVVLVGIALGGLAAGLWLRHNPRAYRAAAAVMFSTSIVCAGGYASSPWFITDQQQLIMTVLATLQLSIPLMFPAAFLSGVLFTLAGQGLHQALHSPASTAGILALWNTMGAALGALAGGFVFLPIFGMEMSLFILCVLYGALGLALLALPTLRTRMAWLCAAGFALSSALFPFDSMRAQHLQHAIDRFVPARLARVKKIRETPNQTLIYVERQIHGEHLSYTLLANGYSMSGTTTRAARYMKLYVYLPVALHTNIKDALLISYGVGSTAKALTDTRSLEHIDVVDISRDILEMNHIVYSDEEIPLNDSRVSIHVDDGRYFLQTTKRHYDLITGEPPPPRIASVVNLYTREYFHLINERLNPGGYATYWLPALEIDEQASLAVVRAFCDAFDDCSLWQGAGPNLMLVGSRGAAGPVSDEHFRAQWNDPAVGPELRDLGFEHPEQLGASFIAGAEDLESLTLDVPPLVDDFPKRITADVREMVPLYRDRGSPLRRSWFEDAAASKERFQRSDFIAQLWPEDLRRSTLPYFEFQPLVNRFADPQPQKPDLLAIDLLLEKTDLRVPVIWALGSSVDYQRMIRHAKPEKLKAPIMQVHLAAGQIAVRDYASAAESLQRAEASPQFRRGARELRAYVESKLGRSTHESSP